MYKKPRFFHFYVIKYGKPPVYGSVFVFSGGSRGFFASLKLLHPHPLSGHLRLWLQHDVSHPFSYWLL